MLGFLVVTGLESLKCQKRKLVLVLIDVNIVPTATGPFMISKSCSGSALAKLLDEVTSEDERKRLIEKSATNFASLLTHIINLVNPDVVYLSGGTFNYENYFNTVVAKIDEVAHDYMIEHTRIVLSEKGSFAGCIGALRNAMKS